MRYRNAFWVVWILFTVWCVPSIVVADTGTAAEPLERLVAEALEQNPQIRAARSRWEAALARIPQASALDDPMIGADVEGIPYSSRSIGNKYMDVEYMVSQVIPFPLKLLVRHKEAARGAVMAEQEYQEVVRERLASVSVVYYDVYRLDRFIEINRGNQSLLQQFAQVAEARYASGAGGQQDVLKAQTEQAMLTNEGITLQQERRSAVAQLNALLNRPVSQTLEVSSLVSSSRLSTGVDALLLAAEEQNPTIRAATARAEMARAGLTLARMDYLPDFSTRLEARQFNEQSRIREYDVMLAVNVPVWSWWKQRNAVREARAEFEAVEALSLDAKNTVAAMVQDRFAKADAAQRLVDVYQTVVLPKAEQALASARAGYEGGRVEFLSLLDAQRTLYEAQQAAEAARASLGQEMARLEEVVGVALSEISAMAVSADTAPVPDHQEETSSGKESLP